MVQKSLTSPMSDIARRVEICTQTEASVRKISSLLSAKTLALLFCLVKLWNVSDLTLKCGRDYQLVKLVTIAI